MAISILLFFFSFSKYGDTVYLSEHNHISITVRMDFTSCDVLAP